MADAKFDLDLADVKPSVLSWLIIGLMSVTFIAFFKWVLTRYQVPGLTDLMHSV